MPEQYIPASTTLSDVLATHSRQLANLMREMQAVWTVIRLIESQQAEERRHRRVCLEAGAGEPVVIAVYEQNPYDTEPLF